ncbi:MAG: tetratricopeptide repeat protein, partial [Geobacteraceae bacterium]|nr:tetratricopeptide repeat protein [Geobacteraceae bacterium]
GVLRQGIRGQKSDSALYNTMAGAYFSQNKTKDALESLQKAKQTNPDHPAPYMNMAGYYHGKKEYGKALEEYKALLKRDPKNLKGLIAGGATLVAMGRDSEALEYYRKAAETRQPAGYVSLAQYHFHKKNPRKALSVLDEAIKAHPRDADALYVKGKILLSEKKYKEAAAVFEELEKVSPERALPILVGTYETMKNTGRAEEYARKIIALKPKSAQGYMALASVYAGRNDLDRAIDSAKKALVVESGNGQVKMALAKLYERKRQFPLALQIYEGVQKQFPGYIPAVFAEGALHEQMGTVDKAVGKYNQVLAKSETYVPALNNLAYIYADGTNEQRRLALRFSARAYRLSPKHPGIMDTYGYSLLRNGAYKEAIVVLEKASSLLPKNAAVHYHLALAYNARGDRSRAVKSLKRAVQLGGSSEAADARKMLSEFER